MERLDVALVKRGVEKSRARAKQLIDAGKVQVCEKIVTKASFKIKGEDSIVLLEPLRYVSRGGLKLEAALKNFLVDVRGLVSMDVGASTGGFTDCLLQAGASNVYSIDVGHDQLAPKLRNDPRVIAIENTDIRKLEHLPVFVDLIVVDVSFISLRLVLPTVVRFLNPEAGQILVLIKPQFEAGPHIVDKKGVIKSSSVRKKVVLDLLNWFQQEGWAVLGLTCSPIKGGNGNVEYLAYLSLNEPLFKKFDLDQAITELFK